MFLFNAYQICKVPHQNEIVSAGEPLEELIRRNLAFYNVDVYIQACNFASFMNNKEK